MIAEITINAKSLLRRGNMGQNDRMIRTNGVDLSVETFVMHGTDDPLFSYGHAEALAREIPGARLVPLPKVGHQMPPKPVWDVVVPAILRHTSSG